MNKKTRESLEGSIKKWQRIVDDRRSFDYGDVNCPLCKLFADEEYCRGCPVKLRTGKAACGGSPYTKWFTHHNYGHTNDYPFRRQKDCPECLDLAKKELAFLESLRNK